MSHRVKPALAIEWAPKFVRAFDAASHRSEVAEELKGLTGISGKTAIIGVARRSLFVRTTRVPNADPATIRQILTMRTVELFPVAPGEVAFDFLLMDDTNMEGRLALVVAIPTGELRRIGHEAREAGLRVERVVPLSLASALMAKAQHTPDAAVVSAEGSGFGIDVVVNGDLRHSRSVAAGSSLPAEVDRTAALGELSNGTTLVAPGVNFPDEAVRVSSDPLEFLINDWPASWSLNLELPEVVAARARAEVRGKTRSALFLAAAAAMLFLFVGNEYLEKTSKVKVEIARAEAPLKRLKSIQKDWESKAITEQSYTKVLDRAFSPAQPLGDVLAVVSTEVPSQAWLTGLSLERGKPIVLRGTALPGTAVTNLVTRLDAQDRFRDVQLVFANDGLIEETPVVQFSISAFPIGNVTVVEKSTRNKRTASR